MNSISRISVEETCTLIQLAREAALTKGRAAQADRLSPVAEQMQSIVQTQQNNPALSVSAPQGVLAQSDFQALLQVTQSAGAKSFTTDSAVSSLNQISERNRMVQAMALAGMPDLDIARQLGMAREEVRLVISASQTQKTGAAATQTVGAK